MSTTAHHVLPDAPFRGWRDYVAAGGGTAIAAAQRMGADRVLEALRAARLRGRGGAGFPTATKWESIRNHRCPTRFAVMNAAEGEPGTFKDRGLLRRNPYAALEGLAIASWLIDAKAAFIGIKASYRPAIDALRRACAEMEAVGALGSIPITIVEGPDEYLFGEEKALLNVIDGFGPFPRSVDEPPYEWGLQPTLASPNPALVNNAETFAHAATIVTHGAESFARLGDPDTPGTVLVTLTGDVRQQGLYEVETSRTLRSVIETEGGGLAPGRRVKAVLSGVSAPVLLPDRLDVPLTFGALAAAGSGLGSAGFTVLDDTADIAPVARAVSRFLFVESCDQCFACKAGLEIASVALERLGNGRGTAADTLTRASFGARSAPQGNRCALPVGGAAVIPSLLQAFRSELREAHTAGDGERPFVFPKISDWDEGRKTFVFDERQALKQPDWSYLAPPALRPREHRVRGPRTVHLPAALADELLSRAGDQRVDFDNVVENALREWLENHRRK